MKNSCFFSPSKKKNEMDYHYTLPSIGIHWLDWKKRFSFCRWNRIDEINNTIKNRLETLKQLLGEIQLNSFKFIKNVRGSMKWLLNKDDDNYYFFGTISLNN